MNFAWPTKWISMKEFEKLYPRPSNKPLKQIVKEKIMTAKKDVLDTVDTAPEATEPTEDQEKPFVSDEETTGFAPNTDFNLEDEYKPEPLVPGGNYRGNVIGVVYEPDRSSIAWKVVLDNNGGVMSDGETPIDGSHHYYRNFLPKPGDEAEMSAGGRSTKRQTKINMMTRFAENMKINMNTPKIIAESLANQDWVGIPVVCTIGLNEYQGVTRNQIDKMIAEEG